MSTEREYKEQIIDTLTPWVLAFFALLAVLGGLYRTIGNSSKDIIERIDNTTLLYLVVGGTLLLFRQVKSLSMGSYKLEMLKNVQKRQEKNEKELTNISMIIPLLFPEPQRKHLLNLKKGTTVNYSGNHNLRSELRRLCSINLLERLPDKHIRQMSDGLTINLSDYVKLTSLGKRWADNIAELEAESKEA
jgi:hypothetical protein